MRKTKIVATIGPASSDPAVFAAMCKAGVNVARLNFSHGTHEEQLAKIHMIKKVRASVKFPTAAIFPSSMPTSARKPAFPLPSMTVPPRKIVSKTMVLLLSRIPQKPRAAPGALQS